jgi:hypothetical protein
MLVEQDGHKYQNFKIKLSLFVNFMEQIPFIQCKKNP